MKTTKKSNRQFIYDKYNQHCGYCGNEINDIKDMQIDHITPIWKFENKYVHGDMNDLSNLMPTCRRCNHYKRGDDLEEFRQKIKTLHERAASHYIGKVAIDYGIIKLKPFNGIFYFETL